MKKYTDGHHRIRRDYGLANPLNVYCILASIGIITLIACFLFSRGTLISKYFFRDTRDTGMDFFHSIEYTRGRKPYEIFGTLYPPLANLFFFVLYLMVPEKYAEQWTYDFSESVRMRGSNLDLRTYQAPMLTFIAFILLTALLLSSLVDYALRSKGLGRAKWTSLFMTVSYGCMCAFERGNIIVLCAGLCLVFVLFYRSENKLLKEIALISLAIAAGLKLYPALLGVLLLSEKDWKAAIRTVIYGIAALILPIFAFEGLSAFRIFFDKVTAFGTTPAVNWTGTSFERIVNNLLRCVSTLTGTEIVVSGIGKIGMILCAVLIVCALILPKTWHRALAATLPMLMLQAQGNYSLCMFLIPLTMFFQEEDCFSLTNIIPFAGLTLLSLHIPVFYTYKVTDPRNAINQIALVSLCIWCWYTTVRHLLSRKTLKP